MPTVKRQITQSVVFMIVTFLFLFLYLSSFSFASYPFSTLISTGHLSQPRPAEFPKKIWQTWKRPLTVLEPRLKEYATEWDLLNPTYRRELIVDDAMPTYIKDRYSHCPEILETFEYFELPVLRADFICYLALLDEGGVYSDIDTKALKPVDQWIPKGLDEKDIGFIVGLEIDDNLSGEADDWTFLISQYTIVSKPGHPILQRIVERIVRSVEEYRREGRRIEVENVGDVTGPAVWTNTVLTVASEMAGKEYLVEDFRLLDQQQEKYKMVANVLFLPIKAFAGGHNHSRGDLDETSLVWHQSMSTWIRRDLPLNVNSETKLV